MFTINQIKEAHAKVKSGADFPRYVQELKTIGLVAYDHYVSDGHTRYYGTNDFQLSSDAKYPPLMVASTGSAEDLSYCLRIHQQGQTDYPTFCQQAAQAGVEKWTVHLLDMTCTYYDQAGKELLVEAIPEA